MKLASCLVASLVVMSAAVAAAADCCQKCGCQCECRKVCRVVCETRTVAKPDYDCECEEFCVPGKSERCVTHDECGKRKIVYTPTCGEVRTRVKLVKKTKTEQVKTYRWVVEDLCERCAHNCHDAVPQPPTAESGAARIFGSASNDNARTIEPVGFVSPDVQQAADTLAGASQDGGESTSLWRRALAPLFGAK